MLRVFTFLAVVTWVAVTSTGAEPTCCSAASCNLCQVERTWRDGPWQWAETANFQVCALATADEVQHLALSCEKLRVGLCDKWLGKSSDRKTEASRWTPRCFVLVHPTAESYLREVGPGQQTAGSSLVEFDQGKLITRRVDLRADHPEGYQDALAHELTHVVVADRFIEFPLPRWADEGIAVLADSTAKQTAHFADLNTARRAGESFRLAELLTLQDYPGANRQAAFYGQSTSVARFLVDRGSADQFLRFVETACRRGYDVALNDSYGISGVAELERLWVAHLETPGARAVSDDIGHLKRMPVIGR